MAYAGNNCGASPLKLIACRFPLLSKGRKKASIRDLLPAIMDDHPDYTDLTPIEQLGAARSFIKLCLCRSCKEKVLDKESGNFKDIDMLVCHHCGRNIRRILMNAANWAKDRRRS